MTEKTPARDRLFALIASIPGSGSVEWCGPARALLDEIAAAAVRPPATDRTALRDRIRRAVCEASGFEFDDDGIEPDEYGEHADAVLAVLPEPADRAAVLREAADRYEEILASASAEHSSDPRYYTGVRDVILGLRRLAAEAAVSGRADDETGADVRCSAATFNRPHGPHRWEPQPGMDLVRCPGACCCEHPEDEHSVYGCAEGCPCEYLPARKKPPMDPVHILGIDAKAPAEEAQFGSDSCTCIPFIRQDGKPRYCGPTDTVDMISGWEIGRDCPHHQPAVGGAQPKEAGA